MLTRFSEQTDASPVRAPHPFAAATSVWLIFGVFFLRLEFILLSGLVVGLLAAFASMLVGTQVRIDRVAVLVGANFVYWLLSAFLVGAIDFSDLLSPGFYEKEGRIFLYYVPLIVFSVLSASRDNLALIAKAARWIGVFVMLLYLIWQVTGSPYLSRGTENVFFGFATSHTGAGTFFGVLCAFLLIYGIDSKHRMATLVGVSLLVPVMASASRQAILSLLIVGLWYVVKTRRIRWMAAGGIFFLLALASLPLVAPHTYERTIGLFSRDTIENIELTVKETTWQPGYERDYEGRQHNVLSRVLFYVYAWKRAQQSPLVGIGYGRYSDFDLQLSGIEGVVFLAVGGKKQVDGAAMHAHNSYLHILAETGVIGLALMLVLWRALYKRMAYLAQTDDRYVQAYAKASMGLIIYALAGAMVGHGLAAPSMGIPILTFVGLGLSVQRHALEVLGQSRVNRRIANETNSLVNLEVP